MVASKKAYRESQQLQIPSLIEGVEALSRGGEFGSLIRRKTEVFERDGVENTKTPKFHSKI